MKILLFYGLVSSLALIGCISQDPAEIHLYSDECLHCKMVISDRQFASQLVSDKGKAYLFDSVECLVAFSLKNPDIKESAAIYLPNFSDPGSWIQFENAAIYRASRVQSPMGLSLFALPQHQNGVELYENAEKLSWDNTLQLIQNEWNLQ